LAYIGNKPANKAIVASDLDPAVITGQTALATSPADTDEFLISDAGTLKRLDASLIGGGKIGQVVQTTKTDTWSQSTSGNTFYNPTNFSRTITPTATSSKILIMTTASFSGTTNYELAGKLIRTVGGSDTELLIGDAASSRGRTFMSKRTNEAQDFANFCMTYLDSPSTTSEITYKVLGATESTATLYLNRGHNDSDNSGEWRTASSIVCMEVLA
jgi:hypothetical protein